MLKEEASKMNLIIKNSDVYKDYQSALARVKENDELYHAMNQFRRRNFELQSYDDGINRYQEIHNLALEYEKVVKHPDVHAFLVAEQLLSVEMREMYDIIAQDLEFDYDYMG